ncbi:conserved unknown protein [Ectocarpus siliculosus]|uniref:P-type Cu(+) transporter n=1 Tax=Ectocarpus siliculosus TaxID=2880 RepID=D8LIV3_ECTSI|nr:conserved unknown protein [Ectocarpus siliculosus]|eukprot:CBN76837.1 conserved unknown protein [Ectocarpus siliculosus]
MMAEGVTGGATPSVPAATAEPRSINNTTPGGAALSLGSGESAAAAAVTAGGTGNNGEGGGGVGAGGAERAAKGQVALINVEGMTCAICVGIVTNLLARVPGVTSSEVSLPLERATVYFDSAVTTPEQLLDAVECGGYEANLHAVDDDGDTELVDPEVKAAKMRAAIKSARKVFLVSLVFSLPLMVVSMGFRSKAKGGLSEVLFTQVVPGLSVRSIIEWVLATPVQFGCGARFYRSAAKDLRNRALGMNFLVAGGTTAAYLYSVVLVLLAVSTAQAHSAMLFFETSGVLISFVLLGKWLELMARGKASNAVGKLLDLRADRAVLVSDWPLCELSGEKDEDASALVVGDVVKVVRGAKVPADGVVLRGNAAVDESMVTGESMPVHKEEGSEVIGATVCSEGLVYIRVTRTGKASALHQIVRLVEQAQGSKAPIQEVGDRVAAVFVPCVVCLSLLTLVVWLALTMSGAVPEHWYRDQPGNPGPALFSFMFSLAVMVIACPCAVGLAAPTAILVGTGVAARHGVLVKGGAALERVSELKRVVFDKTGTLTMGKPRVTEVAYVQSHGLTKALSKQKGGDGDSLSPGGGLGLLPPAQEVLRLVASAERGSEHPLAKAIVEFHSSAFPQAEGNDSEHSRAGRLEMPEDGSTTAVSGKGLSCTVRGLKVCVGSPGYIEREIGSPAGPLLELVVRELQSSGRTVVIAAIERHVAGVFGLVDTLRPEAKGVVSELTGMGLEVWMLTGDNRRAAHEVARRAGLPPDRVCAEVLPGDKASKIEELQEDGKAVAMIGDGINDAPALATADVGIAVGGGTDVAVESADVVLMGSSIWDVFTSLDLCRTILARVRYNYFWALLYNSVGLPIAAGVLFPLLEVTLPPMLAGGAMALSSVSVLLSSLALRLYRPPAAARKARSKRSSAVAEESGTAGLESETATVWTLDIGCTCSCCRDGANKELGAIVGSADGLRRRTRAGVKGGGGRAVAASPLSGPRGPSESCCHGVNAGSTKTRTMLQQRSSPAPFQVLAAPKCPWIAADPETGGVRPGCACSCSFCRCVRAEEP